MRRFTFTALLALAALVVGCGGDPPPVLRPDAGPLPDGGNGRPDTGPPPSTETTLDGGELTEDLSGSIRLTATVTVPVGVDVTIAAGSAIVGESGAGLVVAGTLRLAGSREMPIVVTGDRRWDGFVVDGTLEADFVQVFDAATAITGRAGSAIRFDDSSIDARATRNVNLANGATMDRTRILGGGSARVSGGVLSMTDSTIDLDHPGTSPDCTSISGGTAQLDHVWFTNCHCPLHFTSTDAPISITNSLFDGAAIPMMISRSTGTLTGNVFDGTGPQLQDIGTAIDVDVGGNYFVGSPILDTDDESQFRNADDVLTERPAGVGPRAQ